MNETQMDTEAIEREEWLQAELGRRIYSANPATRSCSRSPSTAMSTMSRPFSRLACLFSFAALEKPAPALPLVRAGQPGV